MQRQSVLSSDIASIGYDLEKQTLEIEFHSGSTYQYANVPSAVYNGLMSDEVKIVAPEMELTEEEKMVLNS